MKHSTLKQFHAVVHRLDRADLEDFIDSLDHGFLVELEREARETLLPLQFDEEGNQR